MAHGWDVMSLFFADSRSNRVQPYLTIIGFVRVKIYITESPVSELGVAQGGSNDVGKNFLCYEGVASKKAERSAESVVTGSVFILTCAFASPAYKTPISSRVKKLNTARVE